MKKLTFGAVDDQFQPIYSVPMSAPLPFDSQSEPTLDRVRRQGCRKLEEYLVDDVGTDRESAKQIVFGMEKLINSAVPWESKGQDSYHSYLELVIKKLKVVPNNQRWPQNW